MTDTEALPPPTDANPEPLLSYKPAAQRLGVSESTLRNYVRQHRIRHVRVGGLVKFPLSAITEFIEANTVPMEKSRRTDDAAEMAAIAGLFRDALHRDAQRQIPGDRPEGEIG